MRICRCFSRGHSIHAPPIDVRMEHTQCQHGDLGRDTFGLRTLYVPSFRGPAYDTLLAPLPILFVIIGGVIILIWAWPVAVLRGRIHEAKLHELLLIDRALRGDTSALSQSIARVGGPLRPLEIIQYQAHIRGLWTWPLHAYAQRLVIFGVLPPLAWIMAALVETFVQSQL
jgi:hypothetical protein